MHVKRLGSIFAIVVLVAACSGGSTPSPSSAAAPATPAPAPSAAEPSIAASPSTEASAGVPNLAGVELTYWTDADALKSVGDLITNFETATGAKVNVVKFPNPFETNFLTKWATGDRPDFFNFHPIHHWFIRLNPEENLVDLSGEAFVAKTKFGLLDTAGNHNGKVYAAIITYPTVIGQFYNKELFAKAGITPPGTLAEYFTACKAFTAANPGIPFGYMGGGDQWPLQGFLNDFLSDAVKAGLVDEINSGATTFNDPRVVAAIQTLSDAIAAGCLNKDIKTANYEGEQKALAGDKAGYIMQGGYVVQSLIDIEGLDAVNKKIGFFPMATNEALGNWAVGQGGSFFVPKNKDPQKQEAAMAFIRYATGEGYAKYLEDSKDYPVLEGYPDPTGAPVANVEANAAFATSVPNYSMSIKAPYGPVEVSLSEMIDGSKTAADVAADLQREFEKAVSALGTP